MSERLDNKDLAPRGGQEHLKHYHSVIVPAKEEPEAGSRKQTTVGREIGAKKPEIETELSGPHQLVRG